MTSWTATATATFLVYGHGHDHGHVHDHVHVYVYDASSWARTTARSRIRSDPMRTLAQGARAQRA